MLSFALSPVRYPEQKTKLGGWGSLAPSLRYPGRMIAIGSRKPTGISCADDMGAISSLRDPGCVPPDPPIAWEGDGGHTSRVRAGSRRGPRERRVHELEPFGHEDARGSENQGWRGEASARGSERGLQGWQAQSMSRAVDGPSTVLHGLIDTQVAVQPFGAPEAVMASLEAT